MADEERPTEDHHAEPEGPEQRYSGHPRVTELYNEGGPDRRILMTPAMSTIGALLAFFTVVGLVVVLPVATYDPPVSPNWVPLTDDAEEGRSVFLANGCVYCHSGFSRPQDVFQARYYLYPRESEPGDYHGENQSPNILGSERTGPDLSQEGGMHPDDWHAAHYANPRFTMPNSIMPRFDFWTDEQTEEMVAFNQQQGGKDGFLRYAAVTVGDRLMLINQGLLSPNVAFPQFTARLAEEQDPRLDLDGTPSDRSPWGLPWKAVWMVNSFQRSYWLTDNPLPLTEQNLVRGRDIYLERCAGCHGQEGAGNGPAAPFLAVSPFNFDRAGLIQNGPQTSDGMFYHRILTAGPGTAMESFGTRLSVDDIWRVVLFLRTIPNGGLTEPLPTPEMYIEWSPPGALSRYIEDHPLSDDAGYAHEAEDDPFMAAARWVAPGLTVEGATTPDMPDYVLVGGQLPIDLETLRDLIEDTYFEFVEEAYEDALERGDTELPPREQIFDTDSLGWHNPS